MKEIESEIEECERCDLHETRTNPTPGVGPADAEVMLIGEAPGYHEDKKGVPFVGAAGEFLTELLEEEAELSREEDVFITNLVKCRPPNNRNPTDREIEACSPYLEKQIQIVKPKLIVALGKFATQVLLDKQVSIRQSHATLADCSGKIWRGKLFISYHPAAALHGTPREVLKKDFRKLGESIRDLDKVEKQTTLG